MWMSTTAQWSCSDSSRLHCTAPRACVHHDLGAGDAADADAAASCHVQRRLFDCPHADAPDTAGPCSQPAVVSWLACVKSSVDVY